VTRHVVVVGSGAAGMAAAAGAATAGADVTVIEAADQLGGTTATSGGGVWIPANPWAVEHGIEDSTDAALAYVTALQEADGDLNLATAYVQDAVRVARLIEHHSPLRWRLLPEHPDYHPELPGALPAGRSLEITPLQLDRELTQAVRPDPYGVALLSIDEQHSATRPDVDELTRREHAGVTARGRGMIAGLLATLRDHGVQVRTGQRGMQLVISGERVVGVRAGGEELTGDVVIATGGFEREPELVRAFLRGPMLAPAGPPTNRGDGLRMGMQAGAALATMSDAWWVAAMSIPGETIDGAPFFRMLFRESGRPGGIVVDTTGRRFANESVNYYALGRSLHERDPDVFAHARIPSWLIFDATRRRGAPIGPLGADDPDPPWLVKASTMEELAARSGLPAAILGATVERFNDGVADGEDSEFGRGSFAWDRVREPEGTLGPVSEAPFYALRLLPGCSGTKGGLATDEHGRVKRLGGDDTIPGLFAAGNASAYMAGTGYPGPGATIGPALVFGWRAGESAAAG
jgi:3-oxosteroid 1-dehydrogenase